MRPNVKPVFKEELEVELARLREIEAAAKDYVRYIPSEGSDARHDAHRLLSKLVNVG